MSTPIAPFQETQRLLSEPGALPRLGMLLHLGSRCARFLQTLNFATPERTAAPGISASPSEDNLRYFNVLILGPSQSPYEGAERRAMVFDVPHSCEPLRPLLVRLDITVVFLSRACVRRRRVQARAVPTRGVPYVSTEGVRLEAAALSLFFADKARHCPDLASMRRPHTGPLSHKDLPSEH